MEIQPIDIFDIADKSYLQRNCNTKDSTVSESSWRKLAGSVYGAMRRGKSGTDIWQDISPNLEEALKQNHNQEAVSLIPRIAQLVMDLHNTLGIGGQVLDTRALIKLQPTTPISNLLFNKYWQDVRDSLN